MLKMHILVYTSLTALLFVSSCTKNIKPKNQQKPKVAQYDLAKQINDEPSDWLSTGKDYLEQRFSALNDIDTSNVSNLSLAWSYDLDTNRGQEATPLMVDDTLYTTSAWSKVQAFNAESGELLWQFDPKVPGEWGVRGCCGVVNRGVAYWDDKIYVGSFDGRLIAIDSKSGEEVWSSDTIVDRNKNYSITGAPRVVKGKVLIGNGGGEFGVRGYVSAYDANTGELAWRFYTVPGDPSKPFESAIHQETAKTWTGEWWTQGGGGTVWDSMAYDPKLDLLYIGVGNGSPWNPAIRSPEGGDNLFLSSIVALKPDTGEYVWHFQTTPGDQWDFTATQHMILADLTIDGQLRKVLMQAPKNGFFYVLDRQTGEFISGENFARVTWAKRLDPKTGRPDIVEEAFYHKTGKPFVSNPGPMGAHSWHPMSFNPQTGLVYFSAQDLAFPYISDEKFEAKKLAVNLGIDLEAIALPDDQKARDIIRKSLKGRLVAWDPVAQKEVWRVNHGGPWNGGTLSTAGGLVFQGNRNLEFAAYNAKTGEKLWRHDVQTGIVAAPITYKIKGEQYIALVAGWGGIVPLLLGELSHNDDGPIPNRSRVLVYKIGGNNTLPPVSEFKPAISIPPQFAAQDNIDRGKTIYTRYCAGCHGDTAVSGGVLPDLRKSYISHDKGSWKSVVIDGVLTSKGMVGFGAELSNKDAEDIRAYIIERAQPLKVSQ